MSDVFVYHGSIADTPITAMTLDKVGSGTGVAHQGVGVYFTSSEILAAEYCQGHTNGRIYEARLLDISFLDADAPISGIDWEQFFFNAPFIDTDRLESLIEVMEEEARMGVTGVRGKILEHLVYADDILDYDDFEVSTDVVDEIEDMRVLDLDVNGASNFDLYRAVKANMDGDTDVERGIMASTFFSEKLGIGGFRYQDGRTQSYGDDTVNYVVFNPALIKDLSLYKPSQSDLISSDRGRKPQ